jgi:hypothetical protein
MGEETCIKTVEMWDQIHSKGINEKAKACNIRRLCAFYTLPEWASGFGTVAPEAPGGVAGLLIAPKSST